jgi:hypothetical protein
MRKGRFFLEGVWNCFRDTEKTDLPDCGRGLRGWKIRGYDAAFLGILVLKKYQ